MKVAVAATGSTLESSVDSRFGRAPGFIVIDIEDGKFSFADNNQNLNAAQGAGIQAAQNVASTGAGAVLAPNFGPKAFQVLQAAGIKMYICSTMPVQEAVEAYKAGKLTEITSANVQGHW